LWHANGISFGEMLSNGRTISPVSERPWAPVRRVVHVSGVWFAERDHFLFGAPLQPAGADGRLPQTGAEVVHHRHLDSGKAAPFLVEAARCKPADACRSSTPRNARGEAEG
jgi:hypothetical protein